MFRSTFPYIWTVVYPTPQNTKKLPTWPPNRSFLQWFGKASNPWNSKPFHNDLRRSKSKDFYLEIRDQPIWPIYTDLYRYRYRFGSIVRTSVTDIGRAVTDIADIGTDLAIWLQIGYRYRFGSYRYRYRFAGVPPISVTDIGPVPTDICTDLQTCLLNRYRYR